MGGHWKNLYFKIFLYLDITKNKYLRNSIFSLKKDLKNVYGIEKK